MNVELDKLPVFAMDGVAIVATSSPAEADRWMQTHVYQGTGLRVPFIGFDTEWSHRPGAGFGVAVVQLATLRACLVLSVTTPTELPPAVAAAIADPRLLKVRVGPCRHVSQRPFPASHDRARSLALQVGISLDQDIQYVELQFGLDCKGMSDLSVQATELGFGSSAGTKYVFSETLMRTRPAAHHALSRFAQAPRICSPRRPAPKKQGDCGMNPRAAPAQPLAQPLAQPFRPAPCPTSRPASRPTSRPARPLAQPLAKPLAKPHAQPLANPF